MRRRDLFAGLRIFVGFAVVFIAAFGQAAVDISTEIHGFNAPSGITWFTIKISNPMSRPSEGTIILNGTGYGGDNSSAQITVSTIPPGESRTLNVAVPMLEIYNGTYSDRGSERQSLNLTTRNSYYNSDPLAFLYVSDAGGRLTEDQLDKFTYRVSKTVRPGVSGMMGSSGPLGAAAATTRTLSASERIITQTQVNDLPENWLCYVPLQYVIMSHSQRRQLTAPRKQALDTWVSLGGKLVLFDEDTSNVESMQFGSITHRKKNPVLDASFVPSYQEDAFPLGAALQNIGRPYRQTQSGGRGGAFLLATLFLIVVGPVNYFYYSRRGQIRKLIVTVPVISLGFCSLIGVYFVLTQGFSRRGGSISVTTLDEASNRAVTFASHSLLSGLYPLGGFHFARQTDFRAGTESRDQASFDLTREIVLTRGMFQPGRPFDYQTITPYTTRERMIYDANAGTIRNGFELPIKAVAVFDGGRFYKGAGAAPGALSKLTAIDATELTGPNDEDKPQGRSSNAARLVELLGRRYLKTGELNAATALARQTMNYEPKTSSIMYAAIFDGIPESNQSGIEIKDGRNLHIVIGRISPGESGAGTGTDKDTDADADARTDTDLGTDENTDARTDTGRETNAGNNTTADANTTGSAALGANE